jgi:DNA modification methylase
VDKVFQYGLRKPYFILPTLPSGYVKGMGGFGTIKRETINKRKEHMSKLVKTAKSLSWHTEVRRVKDLLPWDGNPRTLSDEQAEQLKRSLEKFNLVELPAIDTDNRLIAGHQRAKVLVLLGRGEEKIEVRVPNRKLTEAEFKEYNIRSNHTTGSWDFEKLKDFEIDVLLDIGFDDADLSAIWDDALQIEEDDFDLDREIEKAKSTKIKPGDMFALGRHFLVCGDSTDQSVVKKLVGSHKMDVAYVDLPYNINLSYNGGVGNKSNYGGKTNDNKSDVDYEEFVSAMVANALAVSKPDLHSFFWCDERYIGLFQKVFKEQGLNSLRVCYWLKNGINVTPNVAFNKCLEACVYGTRGKPYLNPKLLNLHELLNPEVGTGNQMQDDVMDHLNIWLAKRDAGQDYQHPTQKPVTLHERPLRRCSKVGDNIIDLTAGSGSTLLACEMLKRRAFVAETEAIFCQVIINRFEAYAREKARKLN